jgi:hypothetical protein
MKPYLRLSVIALLLAGAAASCDSPTNIPNPGEDDSHDDPGDGDGKTEAFFYLGGPATLA